MVLFEITRPKKVKASVFNWLVKGAWALTGATWHRDYSAKHFTAEGAREYRYQRRTRKYEDRKQRLKGHKDPLVFSGRSRRLARLADVRATPKGVRVVLHARQLNRRRHMRREMTYISHREKQALVKALRGWITEGLRKLWATKETKQIA